MMGMEQYPAWAGRDSSQTRRPSLASPKPPSFLSEPETTSAVMGDFQDPYGAVTLAAAAAIALEGGRGMQAGGKGLKRGHSHWFVNLAAIYPHSSLSLSLSPVRP